MADTRGRFRREKAGDDAFALGDVDFLAIAEKVLDGGEAITQIANRCFLHVMHFSITHDEMQAIGNGETRRGQVKTRTDWFEWARKEKKTKG